MQYFLVAMMLIFSHETSFAKDYEEVPLKEFTSLDLYLVPDLGTRLIFPFILDDAAHKPPFYLNNSNGSHITTSFDGDGKESSNGQNSLVVYVKPSAEGGPVSKMLSDLFISVDGYNLSIRLHTTDRLNKHKKNIVFTLSENQRFTLIERQVEARLRSAHEDLKNKKAKLETRSKSMAVSNMGVIAMHTPKITPLKERIKNKLVTGDRVDLVVNSFRNYQDQYYMLDFNVDNRSAKQLYIESLSLFSMSEEAEEPVDISFYCDNDAEIYTDSDTKCLLITSDPLLIRAKTLKMNIATNHGELEGVW